MSNEARRAVVPAVGDDDVIDRASQFLMHKRVRWNASRPPSAAGPWSLILDP